MNEKDHPLSVGKRYWLFLPDGRQLGQVSIERLVDYWAEGSFTPSVTFEDFRQLFDREARLRRAQIIGVWQNCADAIEALGIQILGEDGQVHSRMTIFVEGNEAIIGIYRPGPLPRPAGRHIGIIDKSLL
jgi:hypothetical protein